jgi:hypothetical protein
MKTLLYILLLFPLMLFSQENKRNNIWMLGFQPTANPAMLSGMDFNSGVADTFGVLRQMSIYLTNSSICDTNGQLLFYTNGNYVCNRTHSLMMGTAGFNPGYHTTSNYNIGNGIKQGAIILPKPGNPEKYIIFHMSGDTFSIPPSFYEKPLSLRYSIVDMNLDSGLGGFTQLKNEIIINDTITNGRLTACKHGNGRDWWLITHEAWSNVFHKILISNDSIVVYDSQSIGNIVPSERDVYGGAVFTSNGDYLAYMDMDSMVTVFNFNRCTGELSNPVDINFIDSTYLGILGCAFSRSGRYLYVCDNLRIFQVDMLASDIAASKIIVATWDSSQSNHGFWTTFHSMTLAPDNKIYISTYQGTNLFHVIYSPDSAGTACNVNQSAITLPSYNVFMMPNSTNYALGSLAGSLCDSLSIGITEYTSKNDLLTVFPNPANDENVTFTFPDLSSPTELVINDVHGRILIRYFLQQGSSIQNVKVSEFSPGVYIARILYDKADANIKFIIK